MAYSNTEPLFFYSRFTTLSRLSRHRLPQAYLLLTVVLHFFDTSTFSSPFLLLCCTNFCCIYKVYEFCYRCHKYKEYILSFLVGKIDRAFLFIITYKQLSFKSQHL